MQVSTVTHGGAWLMNPATLATLKAIGINIAKNAVNAALLAAGNMYHNPGSYNLSTIDGRWSVAKVILDAVIIREGIVYFPKLLAWSKTDS